MALTNIGFNQVELSFYTGGGYPPATDIPTVIDGIVATGATWIRIGAFWQIMQPGGGGTTIDYDGLDAALEAATAAGLNVLVCATGIPGGSVTPATFAAFCTALATRYGPGTSVLSAPVRHWEIWNEPNWLFSQPPGTTPGSMYAYQQAAHDGIKAQDSGSFVITAGMIPVPNGFGTTDAVTWLTDLYAAGTAPYPWDGVGFHDYSSTDAAGAQEPTTTQVWIAEIPALHQVMTANGDSAKPVWLTEFGFETQPSGQASGTYVTPAVQAQWLVEQINNVTALAAARGIPLGPQFIYNYRDSLADDGSGSAQDGNGVVDYNFTPKPAWAAIQALISGGAQVGVLSGTGTLHITPAVTGTGTGPSGVKVGSGADQVAVAATGAGAVAIPGQPTAVWAALGGALNPIATPMSSQQSIIDGVTGSPGSTPVDLISSLTSAATTAASAAQTAEAAAGNLLTVITGVVGDFEAEAVDLVNSLTGTNTNGVANFNAIAALQASGITGMAGISYNFGSATPLTNNYAGPYATGVSPSAAWTIPSTYGTPTFGGTDYVVSTAAFVSAMVFTGNPEGSGTDHGMVTDKNQAFTTLKYLGFGAAGLFLSGHGTTTVGQNVVLVINNNSGSWTMQIFTATGIDTGLTARGNPYYIPAPPNIGDVIGLQYDDAAHYTMIYNNTAVGLATGQIYSWYDSGSVVTHGAGYRESGLIVLSPGGGSPEIGLGGTFHAIDYTGAGY